MSQICTALDSSLERWMFTFCRREYWRIAHVKDFDDLIQDGYEIYARTRKRYGGEIASQRHFMRLFQTSLIRHITTLARTSPHGMTPRYYFCGSDKRKNGQKPELTGTDDIPETVNAAANDGPLMVLLNEAKFPVKAVLALFLTVAGQRLMEHSPQGQAENVNHYLARLIGVPQAAYDLQRMVASFLRGTSLYNVNTPKFDLL